MSCYNVVEKSTAGKRVLIIFDWDDTLNPTTERQNILKCKGEGATCEKELAPLERVAIRLMDRCHMLGKVKIVTNAGRGWVRSSGHSGMPRLMASLAVTNIEVISARERMKARQEGRVRQWKLPVFMHEIDREFPGNEEFNVVVIGDGLSEINAATTLADRFPESCVKSVKLAELPSFSQTVHQLRWLLDHIEELCEMETSYRMDVTDEDLAPYENKAP